MQDRRLMSTPMVTNWKKIDAFPDKRQWTLHYIDN
jgi:hypothetical protein